MMEKHLDDLRLKNYSEYTVKGRRVHINFFLDWATERGITEPVEVTRTVLERYQKHVFEYRKKNGEPLGFTGQHDRLVPLRVWFKWMARTHHILHNPASELELPRTGHRLPKAVLSAAEVEQIMLQTNVHDALGLRDRAIMETFYSTGMRRLELAQLKLWDVDLERSTVTVRQGKGKKDRMIPLGDRTALWVRKYLDESRPQLVSEPDDKTVFLSNAGEPFSLDHLSDLVRTYVDAANTARLLSSLPPHHGDPDARRRSRYPLHPSHARPRRSEDHADLHARGDPAVAGDPSRDASSEAGAREARASGHVEARRRRLGARAGVVSTEVSNPRAVESLNSLPAGGKPAPRRHASYISSALSEAETPLQSPGSLAAAIR